MNQECFCDKWQPNSLRGIQKFNIKGEHFIPNINICESCFKEEHDPIINRLKTQAFGKHIAQRAKTNRPTKHVKIESGGRKTKKNIYNKYRMAKKTRKPRKKKGGGRCM